MKETIIKEDDVIISVDGKEYFSEDWAVAMLLSEDVLFLNSSWWKEGWSEEDKKLTSLNVNINDTFVWGCADATYLEYGDIRDLYEHWLKGGRLGVDVWACKKGGRMPQKAVARLIKEQGIWDLDSMGLAPNPF